MLLLWQPLEGKLTDGFIVQQLVIYTGEKTAAGLNVASSSAPNSISTTINEQENTSTGSTQ